MKTVDTVDKSGLPVAAGGVELTEKDLHCVACRLQEFVRMQAFKENAETLFENCRECRYCDDCGPNDWIASIRKLTDNTEVPISQWVGRNGMHLPEKQSKDRTRNLLFSAVTKQAIIQSEITKAFEREVQEMFASDEKSYPYFDRLKELEQLSNTTLRTAEALANLNK